MAWSYPVEPPRRAERPWPRAYLPGRRGSGLPGVAFSCTDGQFLEVAPTVAERDRAGTSQRGRTPRPRVHEFAEKVDEHVDRSHVRICAVRRTNRHQRGEDVAANGENRWP
jgi:hypothetical protein